MSDRTEKQTFRPHLRLIALVGVIVPRRLRADWRQEWEAELKYREAMLAGWDKLDWKAKLALLRRSLGAFRDALWYQSYRWEDEMIQDLRYAVRMLLKRPGFTLIAIFTLSLGIGANTAVFSVVHTVLLRPLPFAEQERLIVAWKQDTTDGSPFLELSVAEFKDWQAQSQSFDSLAVMPTTIYGYGYVMTGRGDALQLESSKVTSGFFTMLGVEPALGRGFNESDDQVNAAKVVVISNRLWRERFDADPEVIGQIITLTEQGYTIIGVMPEKFEFPKGVDLWVPLTATMSARAVENRGTVFLQAVGRLKAGVRIEQAEAELNTIIARISAEHPETEADGQRVVITPLAIHLFGDARPALWLLLAATAMLLLIATANIANLLLARASARRREFAVRAALGAGRFRIIRQLMSESMALALCGGAGGVLLAYWLIDLLVYIAPGDIPRITDVRIDFTVLLFGLFVTLLTAFFFGLFPALAAAKINLNETLSEGSSKLSGERTGKRLRSALIVAEVALTIVLLSGATLILRSFVNLNRVNLGFDPQNVLTMQLNPKGAKYGQPTARREFYRQLIDRLEAQPGVIAASAVLIRPMEGPVGWDMPFTLEGQSVAEAQKNIVPNFEAVTAHYFRTFRIPVKAGREFTDQDTDQSPLSVIISETMAKSLFADGVDPLGKRIKLGTSSPDSPWRVIVGIAGDVRYRELQDVRFDLYVPLAQWRAGFVNHFAVRTEIDPVNFLATVRREVAALDQTQAVSSVATLEQLVSTNLARPRFSTVALGWLSALALLLSAVGVYGVVAYGVAQRTGELGIRIALGAQGRDILKLIIGQGMQLVILGVGIGLIASLALMRLIEKLLFGVSATDPLTFALIVLLLMGVAFVACYLPARRATKVDPWVALRHE
ncbi:MAG: ABC transporter permease [Blastocatellia bacterium]